MVNSGNSVSYITIGAGENRLYKVIRSLPVCVCICGFQRIYNKQYFETNN